MDRDGDPSSSSWAFQTSKNLVEFANLINSFKITFFVRSDAKISKKSLVLLKKKERKITNLPFWESNRGEKIR
jgi:hypothetical protein